MTTSHNSSHIRRFAIDTLTGAGLYFLIATLTLGSRSFAADGLLTEIGAAAVKVADESVSSPGFLMLAAAFAVLFALNAAFFRHLTRLYAPAGRHKA